MAVIYIYGIVHWRILRSSCRKFALVLLEPATTEFWSDALTDGAISHDFNSHSIESYKELKIPNVLMPIVHLIQAATEIIKGLISYFKTLFKIISNP